MRFLFLLSALALASCGTTGSSDDSTLHDALPAMKRTELKLYATAREAYEMWRADPDRVHIIDTRTPEEYIFVGHPPMAPNVPVKFATHRWDAKKKRPTMIDNPAFVEEIRRRAAPSETLLLMCRSGGRSALAADQLAKAGYKRVYSVVDGFEGDMIKKKGHPDFGRRKKNGWQNAGLPWTYRLDPALMHIEESR